MADLEVPGRDRDLRLCDRCFYVLPANVEFCPDCGAPIDKGDAHLAGSDAAVYPELAQANLLRMRGQHKQAEEVCIGILRKYPNQGTATSLLGDICLERGDVDQAIQWYELALDIMPDSDVEKQKLAQARSRKREHEVAETAAQLGLPNRRPLIGVFVGSVLGLIVLTGIAAFMLGRNNGSEKRELPVVEAPVTVGETPPTTQSRPPVERESPRTETTPKVNTTPEGAPSLESALLSQLNPEIKILKAWQDPRTFRIYVDLVWRGAEHERLDAAAICRKAFLHDAKCPKVTVRALEANNDKYLVDSMREAFDVTQSSDWQTTNGDSANALAEAILSNEWRPGLSSAEPTPDSPTGDSDGSVTKP